MVGGGVLLVWGGVAAPNLLRLRTEPPSAQSMRMEPVAQFSAGTPPRANAATFAPERDFLKARADSAPAAADAATGRKIIRTSSMEMVVQHPAQAAEEITALADGLGGYLVSADGGGQDATAGTLTIRVPAARFEVARAEIRKLGVRVESEKIDAQDVSRQYADQDANLRNLRAEESGYLAILKQANTVKDMLAVTERLSEVRGQIEQQQAEFNALSRQVETVALTISLRTEAGGKVLGLNWHLGYQLKLALRDGLESLATYAAAMISILFYLPAAVLWVGTILIGIVFAWKSLRWAGRRWFWLDGSTSALK
jgi:hypothetical protein